MEKVALVTGATGFVGTELCKELAEHDYTVRGLHRVSSDTSKLAQLGVALHRGDVTDRLSLESAMQGVSTVFHIAALFREAKHSDDVYYEVNVEGTRNVFEAAIAAGVVEGVVAERVQTVALVCAVPRAFVRVRRVWARMLFFLRPATK